MDNILLSAALAFIITYFSIPVIIQVAKDKKLFDEPDERKVHKTVIPTLGGLGIFAGFIIATLMGVPPVVSTQLQFVAAAAIVIFFLGIKDDILIISPSKKFIGQVIAAAILFKFANVQISNMHGLFGIYNIPHIASFSLTLFTIIVITNSFNLIDGVDGLAGSLGTLTSLVFGIYFYSIGHIEYAVMAFALAGSLISFLIYNFSPAKIFMGDTGSLLVGLINSVLVIKFINLAGAPDVNFPIEASPAIGFAILMIPLFDTLRVFGHRILDRRSPFSPDRTHIHHFLLDLGFSHRKITLTCVAANILFIIMAYSLRSLGTSIVSAILLATGFLFIGIIYYLRQKNRRVSVNEIVENEVRQSHKIISLSPERVEVE
ncbi:MAG: undecaprenyl/decaprenyl-phosphate alpha-N-acetylglucosaminyl 1-phosphate transferase [Chitinophagaceae bacterium]|nr:undecaprenyl/decaprenyl-phosphate alpha-N-acetylglucosaminyl 1-phosphate transferase [Bacteroidota bacterium]MCC6257065.1 undecaprenyl/decaprenyl-phosphate alpha-N-acetylglucosaminyl 1-phosphate transferase [Chitinophagaceae bacterium]MCW5916608.1 undecaprenyl/decaprenyl-phosphate alpha-N-acetylglucosaminyl 1-phosphate transferase [Ferruginibacter sp.]